MTAPNADSVRAEIEQRVTRLQSIAECKPSDPSYWQGQLFAYRNVLDLLDRAYIYGSAAS